MWLDSPLVLSYEKGWLGSHSLAKVLETQIVYMTILDHGVRGDTVKLWVSDVLVFNGSWMHDLVVFNLAPPNHQSTRVSKLVKANPPHAPIQPDILSP